MIPCPLCWWLTTKKGMADKQNGWWQQESRIRMERDVFVFLLTHLSYACSHFVDPFWWWRQHLQAPTLLVLCIGWCNHFTICRATRALLVNMQAKENSNSCEFQWVKCTVGTWTCSAVSNRSINLETRHLALELANPFTPGPARFCMACWHCAARICYSNPWFATVSCFIFSLF